MGITFQLQKDPKDNRINPLRRFGNWLLDAIVCQNKEEIAYKSISLFKENPSAANLEAVVNLLSNSQKSIRLAASEALATFYFNTKNQNSYI